MRTRVASIVLNNFVNDNRVLKSASSLAEAGYDVTVIALKRGDVPAYEERDGITVKRIELLSDRLPAGKHFTVLRLAELILKGVLEGTRYDIIHCNDFDPMVAVALMKLIKPKLKVVYDTHEYAREKNGVEGLHKVFISVVEPLVIKMAQEVITVSDGIAAEYRRLFHLEKIHVIFNAPHRQSAMKSNRLRENLGIGSEKRVFLYQGGLVRGRGIELLVQAFEKLTDTNAVLVFMGYGRLQGLVEEAAGRLENVFFHPAVPYDQIIEHTASVDFGLLTTQNICLNHEYCMPNKLFEYIQARVPIITTNLSDCRRVVEESGVGMVIPKEDADSIALTVRGALNLDRDKFEAPLAAAAEKYNWENEERKLLEIYAGLGESSPG